VQAHGRERLSKHQAHGFGHVTLLGVGPERVIAEVGALEHSTDDLAQDEDPHDCLVGGPADKEALDVGLAAAGHPFGE
jgi:hypothetical protein